MDYSAQILIVMNGLHDRLVWFLEKKTFRLQVKQGSDQTGKIHIKNDNMPETLAVGKKREKQKYKKNH